MSDAVPDAARSRTERGLVRVPASTRRAPARTKAGTADSRVHNRALVLDTLYHRGPMSRSELARATTLTAPTISALVAELESDGLVVDIGPRQGPRVGKPASLVRIDDGGTNLVVVDLSHADRFVGAVVDLRGVVVERAEVLLGSALGAPALELLRELVDTLMRLAPRRVLGIGVASPGIIDDAGTVRHAVHLGWVDLPLAAILTERFGVPARVGNDVNVAALAVLHFRRTQGQNLMVVTTEHGVGAGLIVGGGLVEGEQFAAGEIGHVTVDEAGDPCICGRRGCLDLFINATHLTIRVANAPVRRRPAVLAEAGRALGLVLAPIVSTLNLKEIVLTGPAELIDGPLLTAAVETTRARTLPAISDALTIRSLAGDDDLNLLGAAALVLSAELGVL